ncbi:sugar kinase [Streptosporangium violaceochromogenes]|nr:sugar kinase [Streptosporangium violaceochromogenes]
MTSGTSDALFVGVDIGTSATRGVVVDVSGEIRAFASVPHTVSTPADGMAEHDAETVWWAGVSEVCRRLMADPEVSARNVAAVGCSGVGPCVLPVDADLTPLRPAILYGVDTRAHEQIGELEARLGRQAILRQAGHVLSSQSAGPKIAWLARHEPDTHAGAAAFLTSQSFVVARLTGEIVIDHATAGYFDPLYDLDTHRWNVARCEDFVAERQLPRLAWASEVAGSVTPAASAATGLPAGVPVVTGTADAQAEAIAAGVAVPGDTMMMYGSSTFVMRMTTAPARSPTVWSAPFLWPGRFGVSAGTSTAGTLTRWLAELLGLHPGRDEGAFEELVRLAASSPPGANGLLTLPYLSGERTPVDDPMARGVVAGLTLRHTRADLARSAIEGVAHAAVDALRAVAADERPIRRLYAVGGGTRNPVWLQAVSDISGIAQHVSRTPGAAFGGAVLAAFGTGHLARPALPAGGGPERVVTPDPAAHRRYAEDHALYRQLYHQTRSIVHALAVPRPGGPQ